MTLQPLKVSFSVRDFSCRVRGKEGTQQGLVFVNVGKARKYSRVPDYRPVVENMKEPKKNLYMYDGIPKDVFPLSKMSRSQRENLVHKLTMDLEQVQDLLKKIAFVSLDTAPLLPYSDIHGCSDGPRCARQENFGAVSTGKQRRPVRKNKQRTKKGPSRHSKSARLNAPTTSTVASVRKECETLLSHLWSHKFGWVFRFPVDPVRLNIPDYFTVIKHPMDFGTIRSRLQNNEYSSPLDFAADVRLTLSNSMAYNPPRNDYHVMAQVLSRIFERRWKVIEKKIPFIEPPVTPLTLTASLKSRTLFEVASPRKKTAAVDENKLRVEPAKLVMTDDEKKKLAHDLETLEEVPENMINFLREHIPTDGQTSEAEIFIDLDVLSDENLFMARKLVDDYLMAKKNSQEKSEPCKIEIAHDSGFSNSPPLLSKGGLESDEDVDIVGGSDSPVSSYFPLKIEKDAECKNKIEKDAESRSSSSSSESSSSSSDSDSSSSSGTETDSIKASDPTSTEDKKEPGVDSNSKGEKIVINDSLNQLGQVGQGVGDKSIAMDGVDVLQDEETSPPKSLVSSDRAALLKNRFADTIWKAREKALTKGEKGDPEKLRIQREKFEKWQMEEKIRLQAEAEAAEEARRKAEAEAAEEARKKREEEREAARQALEKMEKTVQINEDSQFMKDLEMLKAAAEFDQLPTFMEETNPKCSQDVLGSFEMEDISNPLEKLGLYRKMDEDEDEEGQPPFSQVEVDEQPLNRTEREPLSPHGEDEEDYLVSGNQVLKQKEEEEQTLNQVDEDSIKKEDETLNRVDEDSINQIEGNEQVENLSKLENEVLDEEDQESGD